MLPLPRALTELVRGRKVVEVGAGSRFDTALAFAAAGARPVLVTDVSEAVLAAPAPLDAAQDDITKPALALYLDAALVYGVRLPEELQMSAALVAETVGAAYAVRPLKDELADVPMGKPRVLAGGWRVYGPRT